MTAWAQGYRSTNRPEAPVKGDLYYNKSAGFGHVRYVEHEGSVVRVTDVYDGESWVQYDPGPSQFVITVPPGYDGPEEVVRRIVESSVGQETRWMLDSRVGFAVGRAVARGLGLEIEANELTSEPPMTARPDELEDIRIALTKLLNFAPEGGYHGKLAEIGAEVDNVGYAEDADEYLKVLNGDDGRTPIAMMSEAVYYAILGGKEDGRVMNAYIERLKLLTGVRDEDLT